MEKTITVRATNTETGDVTFWVVPEYRYNRRALELSVEFWSCRYGAVTVEVCPEL